MGTANFFMVTPGRSRERNFLSKPEMVYQIT
jgi:hypothetical protein